MHGGGRTLDRLEARLAAAFEIDEIMAIRSQAIKLSWEVSADRELWRRARRLRLSAELVVSELLLSMRARGLLRGEGGDQTGKHRRPPSLADLGLCWPTANRWMTRAQKARSTSPRPKRVRFQDTAHIMKMTQTSHSEAFLRVGHRFGRPTVNQPQTARSEHGNVLHYIGMTPQIARRALF